MCPVRSVTYVSGRSFFLREIPTTKNTRQILLYTLLPPPHYSLPTYSFPVFGPDSALCKLGGSNEGVSLFCFRSYLLE